MSGTKLKYILAIIIIFVFSLSGCKSDNYDVSNEDYNYDTISNIREIYYDEVEKLKKKELENIENFTFELNDKMKCMDCGKCNGYGTRLTGRHFHNPWDFEIIKDGLIWYLCKDCYKKRVENNYDDYMSLSDEKILELYKGKIEHDKKANDDCDVSNETKIYVQPPSPIKIEKPVIYIYSKDDIDVDIKLEPKYGFLCTYPKYNNGWKIRTKKDGTFTCNGKSYNYLYWEGLNNDVNFVPEYCIKGEDIDLFLEEKLECLGLTRKEANEFIVYWLPKMEQNAYNLISFNTEEYCKNNPLSSNPQYETLIRVFMTFKGTDSYIELDAPNIDKPKRDGLAIVEWGGMEIK